MKNNENFNNNADINFDEYTHSPEVEEKEEKKNTEEMQKVVEQFPHAFKKVESELKDSDSYYILRDSGDKSGSTDGDILLSKHGVTIVEGITRIKDGDKKETIETFPFEASDFGDYTLQNIGLNSGKLENSITG
jgi:molybdopterin converting factor small subunit